MGIISVLICTVCYLATSADAARKKDWPMAIVFAGYAFANLGFIMALRKTSSQ